MKVEYGYDKHIRCWNIVTIDDEGNIIKSEYAGNENSAKYIANEMSEDVGLLTYKKIKAY